MKLFLAAAALCLALAGCGSEADFDALSGDSETSSSTAAADQAGQVDADPYLSASIDEIAEKFVKLALAVGQHDPAFVDAYHGPAQWAEDAKSQPLSLADLETQAQVLLINAARANADIGSVRSSMLEKLVRAALTRIQIVQGETFSFDDETRLLYDIVAPGYEISTFDEALLEIEALLPGDLPLNERVDAFRKSLAIPEDKLNVVFEAAIEECRARTLANYSLPNEERFSLEFVTDKPWSGYNWYQGDFNSLIQVNTDFPIIIDRAVELGCHEGYPGHHTWNVMLERDLLKGKNWIEYSVYPLFSPLSIIAEGSANYGIELAFPGTEKAAFERDVLFPLVGLNPADADRLNALKGAQEKLAYARNHIAREYLDGRIDRDTAIEMSAKYGLVSLERAEQSVRFIETYRGYVLNYNIGRDLVEEFVSRNTSEKNDRWDVFSILLSTPLSASDLASQRPLVDQTDP